MTLRIVTDNHRPPVQPDVEAPDDTDSGGVLIACMVCAFSGAIMGFALGLLF